MGWVALPRSGVPYFVEEGAVPPAGARAVPDPTVTADPPAVSASKAVWAEHAAALGVDTEGLTKPQLREAVEELVAASEGGAPVGADVELVDAGSETDELVAGEGDGAAGGEGVDGDVVGHEG